MNKVTSSGRELAKGIYRDESFKGWLDHEVDHYDYESKLPPLFSSEQITEDVKEDLEEELEYFRKADKPTERVVALLNYITAKQDDDGLVNYGRHFEYPRPKSSVFAMCT